MLGAAGGCCCCAMLRTATVLCVRVCVRCGVGSVWTRLSACLAATGLTHPYAWMQKQAQSQLMHAQAKPVPCAGSGRADGSTFNGAWPYIGGGMMEPAWRTGTRRGQHAIRGAGSGVGGVGTMDQAVHGRTRHDHGGGCRDKRSRGLTC